MEREEFEGKLEGIWVTLMKMLFPLISSAIAGQAFRCQGRHYIEQNFLKLVSWNDNEWHLVVAVCKVSGMCSTGTDGSKEDLN